jgi:hypothetical protein
MALGIDNLKKLVKFSLDLSEQVVESTKDGWNWLTDPFSFLDELSQVPGVAKSWPAIKAELADLSPAERTELLEYIKSEFDIPDDKVEIFVENALQQAASLITLVEEFRKLKNTAAKDDGSLPPPPPPLPPGPQNPGG